MPEPQVESRPCPGCKDGKTPGKQTLQPFNQKTGYGMLEQSGRTHLKTKTWLCGGCGQVDWDSAVDVTWETNEVRDVLTGNLLSVPRQIA